MNFEVNYSSYTVPSFISVHTGKTYTLHKSAFLLLASLKLDNCLICSYFLTVRGDCLG